MGLSRPLPHSKKNYWQIQSFGSLVNHSHSEHISTRVFSCSEYCSPPCCPLLGLFPSSVVLPKPLQRWIEVLLREITAAHCKGSFPWPKLRTALISLLHKHKHLEDSLIGTTFYLAKTNSNSFPNSVYDLSNHGLLTRPRQNSLRRHHIWSYWFDNWNDLTVGTNQTT